MKKSLILPGLALSLAIGLTGSVEALTVGLASEAEFTGTLTTLDFESGVVNGPDMDFEPGSTIRTGLSIGAAHSGDFVLSEPDPFQSGPDILARFDFGVYQVGLWFGNDELARPGFTATLSAFDQFSNFLGSTSAVANNNDAHDQFLGLASDDLIYSVVLDYGSQSDTLYGSVDDFSYGGDPYAGGPVPEPATMTLLGLGIAGMGMRRLRQKRSA